MTANPASQPHGLLLKLFDAAVGSARPENIVSAHLPPLPDGQMVVIGAGKASAAMARAVETHYQMPLEGCIVTPTGYQVECQGIEVLEAAHPVPDKAGRQAAQKMMDMVKPLGAKDLVLMLISGGGSSLLTMPADGLLLADKQAINTALLRSGASISEINTVRRHLSAIKGGRLAAACHPARVLNLAISDVPGDQLADIASGPTVADPTTRQDALDVLQRYHIAVPDAVRSLLETPEAESIKPDHPSLAGVSSKIIASSQQALMAAADVARQAGITPIILGDSIEGESREVAKVMAGIAKQVKRHQQPAPAPCVLLSGGETTVTVRGQGKGGRNVEFLLALAVALQEEAGIHALAADTDGIDGSQPVAGAFIGPDTLSKAHERGLSARHYLEDNDAHQFFKLLGDQLITGPTLTNVNDFRAVFIP